MRPVANVRPAAAAMKRALDEEATTLDVARKQLPLAELMVDRETSFMALDSTTFVTRNALPLLSVYLLTETCFFHYCEGWSWRDALYFVVVTLTTIGYGDVTPKSDIGKLGAIMTILFGLSVGAAALGHLVANLTSSAGVGKTRRSAQQATVVLVLCVLSAATFVHFSEGWDAVDSLYWAVVTGSSVGYGDLVPKEPLTHSFTLAYLLLGVGAFATSIGRFAAVLAEEEEERQFESFLSRGVSEEFIRAIDSDGDSEVTRHEFISYCLLSLGKVGEAELQRLDLLFDTLDRDASGRIDLADIGMDQREDPGAQA